MCVFFFSGKLLFIDHDGDDSDDGDERGNWRRDRHLRSLFGIFLPRTGHELLFLNDDRYFWFSFLFL